MWDTILIYIFMHFDKVPKVAVVVDPEIPYFGVG